MAVITGADGSCKIDLGDGSVYVANVFLWNAELRRDMLRTTTQADEFERGTGGMGSWSGSFSFYLQFSDDASNAYSAWQLFSHIATKTGDDLKAYLQLIVQRNAASPDYDIFDSVISGEIRLAGQVVIGDLSLNCQDPERPIVAAASWQADGGLTPERSDLA